MKTLALMLSVLLAPALLAADLDTLLNDAAAVPAGDSKAWLEARGKLTALGQDALPALKLAGAEDNWTSEGWLRALVAQACVVRIEQPELAAGVDAPKGLNPEHYKLARKPEPYCQMELARHGKIALPLLLERWRWTFESFPYSAGNDGKLERECFGKALLFVPGQLEDRRGRFMIEAALRDIALSSEWRQHAAVSLGQTGGTDALATLTGLFDDDKQPLAVREGCGWAIGRVANIKAAEAISSRLAVLELQVELKRALITGAGILGSSWAWKARGIMHKAAGDEVREKCARMLVDALKTLPAEAELIANSLSITCWEASLEWLTELAGGGESAEIRDAAKACIDPLKLAISQDIK